MCVGAVVHSRISRVVYGATEPKAGAVESIRQSLKEGHLNWQVESKGGVLADQCSTIISEFFSARRAQIRQRRHAQTGKEQ